MRLTWLDEDATHVASQIDSLTVVPHPLAIDDDVLPYFGVCSNVLLGVERLDERWVEDTRHWSMIQPEEGR